MLSESKLGFGLMRLPKDEEGNVLIEEVKDMVDAYMEAGLNYFDTAYVYTGSEDAMREALVERYPRESYTIANKLPAWKLQKEEDVERIFNESLERSGVDYFDFYLLHSVEEAHYPTYEKYHCFEFLKRMKEEGKIRHIGFSYHDNAKLLDEILTKYPYIEFVQLQLNYLDWNNPVIQSRLNYEVCVKHNVPVIVMEPVKGGTLASFPEDIEKVYKDYNPSRSIASWAIRFVASLPNVMTLLSGMSSREQMQDNLQTISNTYTLSGEEKECIDKVVEKVLSFDTIPCTKCHYCTPGCPMGIIIPELFVAYNSQKTYGKSGRYKTYYKKYASEGNTASSCIGCGQCEGVCPQHLPIIELLEKVSAEFDEV